MDKNRLFGHVIKEKNMMMTLDEKFKALEADNAPGQEVRQEIGDLNTIMRGEKFDGIPVDFSHGDVDAFPPTPGSAEAWKDWIAHHETSHYLVGSAVGPHP